MTFGFSDESEKSKIYLSKSKISQKKKEKRLLCQH